MKRKISLGCVILSLLLFLCACGSQNTQSDSNPDVSNNTIGEVTSLYENAITILDEFDDPRVDDFREAYALLMNLPSDKDDFITQLDEVNRIFEKYNVDFKYGSWYLQPYLSDESMTKDGISEYKDKNAYWDAENLMQAIVYPVLFDKYGSDAQHIEGLTATNVISAIESTCDYALDETSESYNGCTETWKYIGIPKCNYEIRYHENGLVESVNIPIIRSDAPLDDAGFTDFFAYDLAEQRQFAGNRFSNMMEQLNSIFTGYEVLSQIYSDEEINIIFNYIKSLTIDDIWERNMWTYGVENDEPLNYAGATVAFDYKGNNVSVHYGLNSVYLRVIGGDYVNQLSSAWYTLYCGLALPAGKDDVIESYRNYIDNNVASNDIINEWSFDLDSNASKYTAPIVGDGVGESENNTASSTTIEKIVLSMTENITIDGTVEKNTNAFPQYCLKLDVPIIIVFTEYGEDTDFKCEYLYFYDDAELNGGYDFASLIDHHCTVTAMLEDYRGGNDLYFLNPTIKDIP